MAVGSNWTIRAEALGKEYVLGESSGRVGSLYEVLSEWRQRLGTGGRLRTRTPERFWALRDLSFEVERGEVLGVVGRNGAGKSTLLKILSRITAPSAGRVLLRGEVASLLEVGTGFHPELTGRENIYLNGTILGMRRREIDRKFDEVVSFAEVERFLDTPVKRYSSGMYVRLAFAVAAHLEADILLVDEVLAVGDSAFRKKCMGKMNEVARGGRTVVLVSHDAGAIRALSESIMVLESGQLLFHGGVTEGLAVYESSLPAGGATLSETKFQGALSEKLFFDSIRFLQGSGTAGAINPEEEVVCEIQGRAQERIASLDIGISVFRDGHRLFTCHDGPSGMPIAAGRFVSRITLPPGVLRPGRYTVGLGAGQPKLGDWTWNPQVAALEVQEKWEALCEERNEGSLNIQVQGERIQ